MIFKRHNYMNSIPGSYNNRSISWNLRTIICKSDLFFIQILVNETDEKLEITGTISAVTFRCINLFGSYKG